MGFASDPPRPVTIEGRLVALRPISGEDYPQLFAWRSSIETVHMLNFRRHVATYEQFVHELERLVGESIVLLVSERKSGKPIGFSLAYHIDPWDGWLFVAMFVEPEYRFRGHGGEAALLALDSIFRWFPVRKVYTEVYDFAEPLVQMARGMGFEEVGYQPDHYWHEDRFWGIYRMALSRDRWLETRDDLAAIIDVQRAYERLTVGAKSAEVGGNGH